MATTQFFRKDGWIKSVLGPAIPGAQIWVCQQPANATSLPPSPLASVFSDPDGLVPLTLPAESDGFGHYSYYIAPGLYTEIISLNNVIQQVYPDQDFGLGNAGPGNPYTAGNNITIVGNVISAVIPAQVTVDLQTNSVDNTLQTKLNLKNGTNISLTSDSLGGTTITNTQIAPPIGSSIWFSTPTFNTATSFFESPANTLFMVTGGIGAPTTSLVPPTSTLAGYMKQVNSGSSTFNAYFITNGGGNKIVHGYFKSVKISAATFGNTSVRYWICPITGAIAANAGAGSLESNAPLFVMTGFRFSTSAGDTHWMAICNAASGAQTTVDTGITPDTTGALHVFETRIVQGTPGTINFYIDNVAVGSITSANVPVTGTSYGVIAYAENLSTVSTAIGWNYTIAEFFQ